MLGTHIACKLSALGHGSPAFLPYINAGCNLQALQHIRREDVVRGLPDTIEEAAKIARSAVSALLAHSVDRGCAV